MGKVAQREQLCAFSCEKLIYRKLEQYKLPGTIYWLKVNETTQINTIMSSGWFCKNAFFTGHLLSSYLSALFIWNIWTASFAAIWSTRVFLPPEMLVVGGSLFLALVSSWKTSQMVTGQFHFLMNVRLLIVDEYSIWRVFPLAIKMIWRALTLTYTLSSQATESGAN